MYILTMMSNVIYFNIFTIKHEMERRAWCVLCGGQVGDGAGVGRQSDGGSGAGRSEDSLGVKRIRVVWKG